jgi:hypothetical protein
MEKMKLEKISIRIDPQQLELLKKTLNQVDSSKAIRGAMNFTVNVAHNLFSGNLSNMFKRKKGNEEVDLYDNQL